MADWSIAPLDEGDIDELARVHVAVWREAYAGVMPADYLAALDPARFAERRRELTAQRPSEQTLVARDVDGEIVGFAAFGPSRDDDPVVPDELYAINLLARIHGSGLAGELLERATGGGPCTLWVVADNRRARRFYERHGFVDEGGRQEHHATGTPEIRMIRRTVSPRA